MPVKDSRGRSLVCVKRFQAQGKWERGTLKGEQQRQKLGNKDRNVSKRFFAAEMARNLGAIMAAIQFLIFTFLFCSNGAPVYHGFG